MGMEGQQVPHMTDEFVQTVSQRYIRLYELVTGRAFEGDDSLDPVADVQAAVEQWLKQNR